MYGVCYIVRGVISFEDQTRPMLSSIRNVQGILLQSRRIGGVYRADNSLTPQHQEQSPRGLEQRVKEEASSQGHSPRHE
jgi:hypothetical protein